jgi:hypothetical protein
MDILLYVLIGVSLAVVTATFFMGMFSFALNENSNRFMGWRVKTQAVAIAILFLAVALKVGH